MSKRPDSVVYIDTGAWKVKVALGTMGIIGLVILAFIFRFEAGIIMLAAGAVTGWRGLIWVNTVRRIEGQNLRRMEAETRQVELRTDIIAQELEQARQKTDEFRLAKLIHETRVGVFRFANVAAEPVYIPASAGERRLLDAGPVIEAGPEPLDFATIMSDPKAAYAILGPQRVGKSFIAMHLSDYLASRGLGTNLVVGVKMEAGEWPNCKQFIGEREVNQALRRLISTTNDRHQKVIREPRLNIFLDDWINIVATADLAEEFFLRSATDMLTAGIVPYFILQSDSNADWGNKYGATLKNNFVKLILKPHRVNGKVIPEMTTAYTIFPGERNEHPTRLPGGLPQLGPPPAATAPAAEPLIQEQEPDAAAVADAEFVERVRGGESRRAAALRAYKREYAGSIVTRAKRALGEIEN